MEILGHTLPSSGSPSRMKIQNQIWKLQLWNIAKNRNRRTEIENRKGFPKRVLNRSNIKNKSSIGTWCCRIWGRILTEVVYMTWWVRDEELGYNDAMVVVWWCGRRGDDGLCEVWSPPVMRDPMMKCVVWWRWSSATIGSKVVCCWRGGEVRWWWWRLGDGNYGWRWWAGDLKRIGGDRGMGYSSAVWWWSSYRRVGGNQEKVNRQVIHPCEHFPIWVKTYVWHYLRPLIKKQT